jgi:hypothetical protein
MHRLIAVIRPRPVSSPGGLGPLDTALELRPEQPAPDELARWADDGGAAAHE